MYCAAFIYTYQTGLSKVELSLPTELVQHCTCFAGVRVQFPLKTEMFLNDPFINDCFVLISLRRSQFTLIKKYKTARVSVL